jgi:DNA polymerase-3 subunit alpha
MQAAQILAGYTLGGADLLRRAMGKKDKKKMAEERIKFCKGAAELHGIKDNVANEIFDTLEKFAGYGFNRSHSAAYAWVSYQTAYLKANYPVEFMAAVMSNEVANTEKISTFVAECERLGITILAPDVNKSGLKFVPEEVNAAGVAAAQAARKKAPAVDPEASIEEEDVRFEDLPSASEAAAKPDATTTSSGEKIRVGSIRFGLAAIKNVGESAMEAAVVERERGGKFKSLEDFCSRIDSKKLNKKSLECLVKCGAFDWTGIERATLFAEVDGALAAAASAHRDRAAGQVSLFDAFDTAPAPVKRSTAPKVTPWTTAEKLAFEKELLGFYVTGHPLDDYRPVLESGKYVPIARLSEQEDKSTVSIAGALTTVDKKFTKKDSKPFAIVVIEDLTGPLEVMIWSEAFSKSQNHLVVGNVVSITGRLDRREEAPRISANEVKLLKKPAATDKPVVLSFKQDATEQDLTAVREIVAQFPGSRSLELCFQDPSGNRLRMRAGKEFKVSLTAESEQRLAQWLTR